MAEKDFSLIAYTLGIISIVLSFFTPLAGIIFGIIGIIFSNKQKNDLSKKAKTLGTIGIILGSIVFISVVATLYFTDKLKSLISFPM